MAKNERRERFRQRKEEVRRQAQEASVVSSALPSALPGPDQQTEASVCLAGEAIIPTPAAESETTPLSLAAHPKAAASPAIAPSSEATAAKPGGAGAPTSGTPAFPSPAPSSLSVAPVSGAAVGAFSPQSAHPGTAHPGTAPPGAAPGVGQHLTACFVDFQNLAQIAAHQGETPSISKMARLLLQMSRRVRGDGWAHAQVYANWPSAELAVQRAWEQWGHERYQTVHVPGVDDVTNRAVKNPIDFRMALDVLEAAYAHPEWQHFALVSGDGDFAELTERLRRLRRHVEVVALQPNLSSRIQEAEYYVWSYQDVCEPRLSQSGRGAAGHSFEPSPPSEGFHASGPAPRVRHAVCFVDFQNVFRAVGTDIDTLSIQRIARRLSAIGKQACGAVWSHTEVYANWDEVGQYRRFAQEQWSQAGYDTCNIPTREDPSSRKSVRNMVDFRMSLDMLELALTHPEWDHFVLVSGDGDFCEIVQRLQALGRRVQVVAHKNSLSQRLKHLADSCVEWTNLDLCGSDPIRVPSYRRWIELSLGEASHREADPYQLLRELLPRALRDYHAPELQWALFRDEYLCPALRKKPDEVDHLVEPLERSGFVDIFVRTSNGKPERYIRDPQIQHTISRRSAASRRPSRSH